VAFICGIFVANVVAYVKVTNIHRVTKKSRQRVVFSEPKNELSIPKKAGSEMFLSSLGTCVSPTRAWWHVGRVRLTSQCGVSEDFKLLGARLCPFYVETSFLQKAQKEAQKSESHNTLIPN
jgi:hypothetical protein